VLITKKYYTIIITNNTVLINFQVTVNYFETEWAKLTQKSFGILTLDIAKPMERG